MPNPADIPFELTRTTLENTLRSVSLMEEIQQNAAQVQLQAIGRALANAHDTMNQVSRATDWTALGVVPSLVLRHAMEQNTALMQSYLKLIADAQAACLSGARDASESLQRCQADAMASSASSPPAFPLQAMFAQASETVQAMAASARNATMQAQSAMQGAARPGKRSEHAG
ncbi:hypothetical protein [Paracidovorax citrulli]